MKTIRKYICKYELLINIFLTIVILSFLSISENFSSLYAKDQHSEDSNVYDNEIDTSHDGFFVSSAVGLGLNWMLKKEYGEVSQKKVVEEASIHTYFRIKEPFYIRHSIHAGYSGMTPNMPQSLRVIEKEFLLLSDLSFLYNWYVVPVLSAGAGSIYRDVSLKVREPVHMDVDEISDTEWIFMWYLQLGVTLPVLKNRIVLEPFVRFVFIDEDKRTFFAFGFDLSYYLVKRW